MQIPDFAFIFTGLADQRATSFVLRGLDSVADRTISCEQMASVEVTKARPAAGRLFSSTQPQTRADLVFDC